MRHKIGVVTSGSLLEGLTARLDDHFDIEQLRVGQFVVIQGGRHRFFSMLTDVQLAATSPAILADPPGDDDPLIAMILAGRATYGTFKITPQLMLSEDVTAGLRPVKTIPSHFAPIFEASEDDFSLVFGQEGPNHFQMGQPLDMDVPVCIDLTRFAERSNGVFGKSGTGKSFLTRLLLCGIIKEKIASTLIFDMHSEYGWSGTSEDKNVEVKGLAQLFGRERVMIFTLDAKSTRRRGASLDGEITIGLDEIEVEDLPLLEKALSLNPTAIESAYICLEKFGKHWIKSLRDMNTEQLKEFVDATGANLASISALKRKLIRLERLHYVTEESNFSAVNSIIESLMSGKNVVIEFGQYNQEIDYILVSNILTRRIYKRWVEQSEIAMESQRAGDRPPQLIITIEEAHKFLSHSVANQTIFGTIARELRKYSVTLLVIDQRPSSIDPDVMSQLGSRITALLNDERDIDAVFTGVSGSKALKTVLASLDSRQQCLILGHAVPMPVVLRTRPYDTDFYRAMGIREKDRNVRTLQAIDNDTDDLFA